MSCFSHLAILQAVLTISRLYWWLLKNPVTGFISLFLRQACRVLINVLLQIKVSDHSPFDAASIFEILFAFSYLPSNTQLLLEFSLNIYSQKDKDRLKLEKRLEELFRVLDQVESNLVCIEIFFSVNLNIYQAQTRACTG